MSGTGSRGRESLRLAPVLVLVVGIGCCWQRRPRIVRVSTSRGQKGQFWRWFG